MMHKLRLKKPMILLASLLAIALVSSGCAALNALGVGTKNQSGSEKTIVISEDAAKLQDDSPPLSLGEKQNVSLPSGVEDIAGFIDNETLLLLVKKEDKQAAKLALLNVKTGSASWLNSSTTGEERFLSLAGNGKKLLYKAGNELYSYDVAQRTSQKLKTSSTAEGDEYFADYNGQYIINVDHQSGSLKLQDLKTGAIKTSKLGTNTMIADYYKAKQNDSKVYLRGSTGGKQGILSVDLQTIDNIKAVVQLPDKNDTIAQFDFIDEDSIIFAGTYGKEPGIFIYDGANNSVKKIVSGSIDKSEGPRVPFYSLAQDKSMLLYETFEASPVKTNIYAAKLSENMLTSKKLLYKNVRFYGVIMITSWWNPDNATVLVDEQEYEPRQERRVFKLRKFTFSD